VEYVDTSLTFRCQAKQPTDNSSWHFQRTNPEPPPPPAPESPAKQVNIYPLGLECTAEQARNHTAAIEKALEMAGGKMEPGDLTFHDETKLLLARALPEHLQLINNVVQAIQNQAGSQSGSNPLGRRREVLPALPPIAR
jgi:hypothetical protein